MRRSKHFPLYLLGMVVLPFVVQPVWGQGARWVGETLEGRSCDSYAGRGARSKAYDYTDPRDRQENLGIVERRHFTEQVRSLQRGETHPLPLGDIAYTLGRFPNHHSALYAMIRYATEDAYASESEKAWAQVSRIGEYPAPECYIQRAIDFAPRDHKVRILAGIFFHRIRARERAQSAYERALEIAPDSAEAHYNYGLLLSEMEKHEQAREHAEMAYDLGFPLQGLRKRLAESGFPLQE